MNNNNTNNNISPNKFLKNISTAISNKNGTLTFIESFWDIIGLYIHFKYLLNTNLEK